VGGLKKAHTNDLFSDIKVEHLNQILDCDLLILNTDSPFITDFYAKLGGLLRSGK
jgi:hypothetical protein